MQLHQFTPHIRIIHTMYCPIRFWDLIFNLSFEQFKKSIAFSPQNSTTKNHMQIFLIFMNIVKRLCLRNRLSFQKSNQFRVGKWTFRRRKIMIQFIVIVCWKRGLHSKWELYYRWCKNCKKRNESADVEPSFSRRFYWFLFTHIKIN